tara:strand:+ start:1543 stop:2577 length:1035 start_codon:yes stop_codon:yes gene_type:complete
MTEPVTGQDIIDWYKGLDPDTQGDLTDYYDEIIYDSFKTDDIYKTVFAQGNWGDINDATLETFGEVKTYINDTIFATEHQTVYDDDEYVPSVDRSIDGGPKYIDVSEYMDGTKGNIDRTLPEVYARPDPVAMPHSMLKYSSRAKMPQWTGDEQTQQQGWDFLLNRPQGTTKRIAEEWAKPPGNIDTLGDYQRHLDQVKADRIEAGKADFVRLLEDNQKRADAIWARRTKTTGWSWQDDYEINKRYHGRYDKETKPLFKEVIGSDKKKDIQAWMAMSNVGDLTYENWDNAEEELMRDGGKMDRIKFVYDYYGGVLPTTQQEFETRGDPLIEWGKDKGKSWRKQNK